MPDQNVVPTPTQCPACAAELVVSRLECPACGTEVTGAFQPGRLLNLPEPHASLLELFLRVRGNVKDMERELGISYPIVRARLEKAIVAAGLDQRAPASANADAAARRATVLDQLEQGSITATEAAVRLRELQRRRVT